MGRAPPVPELVVKTTCYVPQVSYPFQSLVYLVPIL
jgi:hypothetical protein